MKKVECFILEESASCPGKWLISPIHENFHLDSLPNGGSCNIICARLLGLSYAQYLRFCRDLLKGELHGKQSLYPIVYLPNSAAVRQFIKLLNNLANMVLWEREHPDWRENSDYVAIKKETSKNLARWN